jgi:hypothetical protein
MAAGLTVKIKGDASHFDKTLKSVKGGLSSIKTPLTAVAAGAAAVGAAIGAAAFGAYKLTESLIDVGEAARKEDAVLGNVVKRMGLFGTGADKITAKMIKYADATELATGIDAGIIKSTQAKLSTFEEVAKTAGDVGGAFDRATKAALDMSIVFGGDASQYAVQLGKALQDPEKGLAALKKTGALTRVDIERIGAEFASSGNKAKAFDQILSAIERQVGGAADAAATGTSRIRAAFNQMRDELAVPVSEQFDRLADQISKQTPAIVEAFQAIAPKIADAASKIFNAFGTALTGDTANLVALGVLVGNAIMGGIEIAFKQGMSRLGASVLGLSEKFRFAGAGVPGIVAGFASNVGEVPIGQVASQAADVNLQSDIRTLINTMRLQFEQLQGFQNQPQGIQYDPESRLEVLLQSIDRKLNPTPFPAR